MMSNTGLRILREEIEKLGYDAETSAKYAAWIGAAPIRDQDNKIVVIDDTGKEVARLKLPMFEE